MSERHALIVGVDDYPSASNLGGARNDAADLFAALVARGVVPSAIRVLTSPMLSTADLPGADPALLGPATADAIRDGVAWLAERLRTDDDAALLHFSGHGCSRADVGPCLAAHDADLSSGRGLIALDDLLAPLRAAPIRSVLVSIDAGFAAASPGARSLGGPAFAAPALSGDPVLLAAGLHGAALEATIDGAPRGLLAWALARALRAAPLDPSFTFGDLLASLRRALDGVAPSATPAFAPADAVDLPLGSFVAPGPAHVPWRGVQAFWQISHETADIVNGGNFIVGTDELWVWPNTPWPTSGFTVNVISLNPGQPGPGTQYRFTNNGFGSQGSSTPPTLGANDRMFRATWQSLPQGARVFVIVRGVSNPTAIDWYTTVANTPFLPVAVNDQLDFVNVAQVPGNWSSSTWYAVSESRQP